VGILRFRLKPVRTEFGRDCSQFICKPSSFCGFGSRTENLNRRSEQMRPSGSAGRLVKGMPNRRSACITPPLREAEQGAARFGIAAGFLRTPIGVLRVRECSLQTVEFGLLIERCADGRMPWRSREAALRFAGSF
jgi:hypothetical protein